MFYTSELLKKYTSQMYEMLYRTNGVSIFIDYYTAPRDT
jgi:hypothetical protein